MINLMMLIALVIILSVMYHQYSINKSRRGSKMSFKESMDLTELPVVTFMIGECKVNFLLDTGSNISYINETFLDNIKHEPLKIMSQGIGIDGTPFDIKYCNLKLTYKEYTFDSEFGVRDIDEAFGALKKENGINIHGILGSRFFEEYNYVFDFKDLIAYIK